MDGYGKRVLIVDDDHHARFLLGTLLEHAGYTVVPACDGRAALIELHKRHFDAVVTDYRMPFLNGIELLRQIQIHYPQMPVILASGAFPDSDELFQLDCQPFGRLRKPYDTRLLLRLVRSAVGRQRVACEDAAEYQPTADLAADGCRGTDK
jgi:DNA-binding response OmpR family regulator